MTPAETVEWMKKNHVLAYRSVDGLEIKLADQAFEASNPPKPDAPTGPSEDEVGSTGMTRRQQIDLYGQVFEGDFAPGTK